MEDALFRPEPLLDISKNLADDIVLACLIANIMCALVLAVLMCSVPSYGNKGYFGKHCWSIVGFLLPLISLPQLFSDEFDRLDIYNATAMFWVLPVYAAFSTKNLLRRYAGFAPFFRDAWPVLAAVLIAFVAGLSLPFRFLSATDPYVRIASFVVALPFCIKFLDKWVDFDLAPEEFIKPEVEHGSTTVGSQYLADYKRFFNVIFAQKVLLIVVAIPSLVLCTPATFLLLFLVLTVCNLSIFFVILVTDTTKSDIISEHNDIKKYMDRVVHDLDVHYQREYAKILERDAYNQKEYAKLLKRLTALENSGVERLPYAQPIVRIAVEPDDNDPRKPLPKEVDTMLCAAVNAWILSRGFCNRAVNLDRLAQAFGTNRSYLSRCINDHWGEKFSIFLAKLRVNEACRLMSERPLLSISSVADLCGFNDTGALTRWFKQFHGVTPTNWRNAQHRAKILEANGGGVNTNLYNPFNALWKGMPDLQAESLPATDAPAGSPDGGAP